MDNFSAGIVAIPLIPQEGFSISPNFFVVDSVLGKVTLPVNPVTKATANTDCTLVTYRIIFREILPEDIALGKSLEMEDIVLRSGTLQVPIEFVPMLFSLQRVSQNVESINIALGLFSFRGIMAGYKLEVDVNRLTEHLNA